MKEPTVPECRHWIGSERRHCRSVDHIHPYLTGPCCPLHTPAALAGKPEPPPGPGLPPGGLDDAQATVDHRTELNL
ncbi:hypothetical protein [Streptomyces sp. NBC_00620]|uniref:hypothetical protein n=1 Tax=Streptomyces sp. NBC_00620 TaxID=2903666 RepID=UPI0022506DE3|nr:hypothetical protein [Streptomyces sp. NBC_00620]MCX4974268.1 hypothetical protein [Streptomyces sp. NBC_00620]